MDGSAIDLEGLELKIDEVSRALKLTLSFEIELRHTDVQGADYIHGMAAELEDQLAFLRSLRDRKLVDHADGAGAISSSIAFPTE